MGEPEGEEGRRRLVLLVLASVQFTNIVDFMIVMPLGPQLMEALRLSPSRFGLIVSSYTLSACVAGLLASTIIDRFDRKVSFLTLYAGFLVGTLLCGLATSYPALLAARILTGAFGGILGGQSLTIIGDVFPEERRGAATGALMSAFAVASVVGVPFGLYLGTKYGWNTPFFVLAGLSALALPIAIRALPSIRGHLASHVADHPLRRMWEMLSHPDHLRAFALMVTMMLGGFSVIPYISAYLVFNVGIAQESLPATYVAGGLLTLVCSPLIGRLADRIGKLRMYRIVAPASAVLMLVLTNLPPVPLAVAVAVTAVLMASNAGRMVVALAMITACVEPRRRGGFMSINSAVQHLSTGLGAFIGGLILDRASDGSLARYPIVGLLAAASTVASLVLAGLLRAARGAPVSAAEPDEATAAAIVEAV
jgi:predicted MFS family arabinose efflux permease